MSIAKKIVWSGLSAIVGAERALSAAERIARRAARLRREVRLVPVRAKLIRDILNGAYHFDLHWNKEHDVSDTLTSDGARIHLKVMGGWQIELDSTVDRGDGVHDYLVDDATLPKALMSLARQMVDNTFLKDPGELPVEENIAYGPPTARYCDDNPARASHSGCQEHGYPMPDCQSCIAVGRDLCAHCHHGEPELTVIDNVGARICKRGHTIGHGNPNARMTPFSCFQQKSSEVELDLDGVVSVEGGKVTSTLG